MGSMRTLSVVVAAVVATAAAPGASAAPPSRDSGPTRLAAGLEGATGSAVGPGGALYVTEGASGTVSRVHPRSGRVTTYATGLPRSIVGLGGAIDVAFVGGAAYVLVTAVGPDVGGADTVGIYRVDGPRSFTVVADIGAFALGHPPDAAPDVATGVQYALEPYRGGFLVTDGHHNRVLRVSLDGEVSEVKAFGNVVPTGLEVSRGTVYMAQAGPIPYRPRDGKVLALAPKSGAVTEVASGASFLVDVESGRRGALYALSQGVGGGEPAGAPARPDTGSLVRVTRGGRLAVVVGGLDRPTSMEIIRDTAYVVTLAGEVWKVDGLTRPSRARRRGR
jgi:hypothetical protein